METVNPGCVFCERILQRPSDIVWDQRLTETPDYVVVPTKGALVPGWLLVVSKEHALCAGALPHAKLDGLKAALDDAKALVEPKFGPVTFFEHGPVVAGTGLGCGIDHLHVHVAPLNFSLREAFLRLYPDSDWHQIGGWCDLQRIHGERTPYVTVLEPGRELEWCVPPVDVRQPLRRAVAGATGAQHEFDYNVHEHHANAVRTLELLAAV